MSKTKIITADERLSEPRGANVLLVGPPGVGKTTLLASLSSSATLFVDLEAGDLAVQGVPVDAFRPRNWEDCRDLAVCLAGPNPAYSPTAMYSQAHYERVISEFGGAEALVKYRTYFIDSLTVAARLCFRWAQQQPEAMNDRGKPDTRGAYGLLGREMISWLTHLQHAREKNVIFVAILESVTDEFGRKSWQPQIEGSKTGRELPGIVDQVITYQWVTFAEGDAPERCFVCTQPNTWQYPAKDRSGRLDQFERPDLGALIEKITAPSKTTKA